jgi:hypothetical protein
VHLPVLDGLVSGIVQNWSRVVRAQRLTRALPWDSTARLASPRRGSLIVARVSPGRRPVELAIVVPQAPTTAAQ